jgi:hypothetical protein
MSELFLDIFLAVILQLSLSRWKIIILNTLLESGIQSRRKLPLEKIIVLVLKHHALQLFFVASWWKSSLKY